MIITLIGSLIIIIKKRISRRIIQRIPKSNILAQTKNNQEQSIEMASLHSTPRIIKVGLTDIKTNTNLSLCLPFSLNNSKHNKNIINSYGLFIVGVTFCIFLVLVILSKFGWITQSNVFYHLSFASFCCIPVILSTVYFMRNPKHLISVLQDHKNLM
jgi:hypothetical protein